MKLHEIEFVDGDRYITKDGKVWTVSQKELSRKYGLDKTEYIDGGAYAIGDLVHMDFLKLDADVDKMK